MMTFTRGILFALFFALCTTSCTGGKNASIDSAGSIKITLGDKLEIDLRDIVDLNVDEYTVTIREIAPDYSIPGVLTDLTPMIRAANSPTNKYKFTLPKEVQAKRPFLVVVDLPSLSSQMYNVVYDGQTSSRPGIASTLVYNLMKYYPHKAPSDFSATDYQGTQALIQTRIDQLDQESEQFNRATVTFKKLMRYYTNGVAFNIDFLTKINDFGFHYTFTKIPPPGLLATDTPENSLDPYLYATQFKVDGNTPDSAPLNAQNDPPMLLQGVSAPNPGTGIFVSEGKSIAINAEGFDIDDDFIDKNMIVQYIPRVLPTALTSTPGYPVIPEPTPEYTVLTDMTGPGGLDTYISDKIRYNEALDTVVYPSTLPFDPAIFPSANSTDTAYRNIYYLISDGMVRVPYRWNYKYSDINRAPVIAKNANGYVNDTSLDSTLAANDTVLYTPEYPVGTSGWKTHASHCETNPDAKYTDPATGGQKFYQRVLSRADGPWNCVFKVTDPDIDDDPNAAADTFYYSATVSDNYTTIMAAGKQLWPVYVGPPYVANMVPGTTIKNCVTPDGVVHPRCGLGNYQVQIDNSVKVAAESQAESVYLFDVNVYDRAPEIGGLSTTDTLNRMINFDPVPARLVNFSQASTPGGNRDLTLKNLTTKTYIAQDIYVSEIMDYADPDHSITDISQHPIDETLLTGSANRTVFLPGDPHALSDYFTQPHANTGGSVTVDNITKLGVTATPGGLTYWGHSLTASDASTYKTPREQDTVCRYDLYTNQGTDVDGPWDQGSARTITTTISAGSVFSVSSPAPGWVFELDAVDTDNAGLKVGEPSDPVSFTMNFNVDNTLNPNGLMYCQYLNPNSDNIYYQTYQASGTAPAIDPEACQWTTVSPKKMQPIPVFYQTTDSSGNTVVKKLVYHRLRLKWQPRDQGFMPKEFIKNAILAGFQTAGQRASVSTLDQMNYANEFPMYAKRRDMPACFGTPNNVSIVETQVSQAPLLHSFFYATDPNKVFYNTPPVSGSPSVVTPPVGSMMGRNEVELKLLGTRPITDPEFEKFVPYTLNCGLEDSVDPTPTPVKLVFNWPNTTGVTKFDVKMSATQGASATGTTVCSNVLSATGTGTNSCTPSLCKCTTSSNLNALSNYYFSVIGTLTAGGTLTNEEIPVYVNPPVPSPTAYAAPAIWYSPWSDASNIPRLRLKSVTNGNTFCIDHSWTPLQKSGVRYDEVWLIENLTPGTDWTMTAANITAACPTCSACIARSSISMSADQHYLAIASNCGLAGSHTKGQTLWSNAYSKATVGIVIDPTLSTYGGFTSNSTIMSLDMFPSLYQADSYIARGASASGAYDNNNGLFFDGNAIDTFKYDPVLKIPNYQGYRDLSNNPIWIAANASNIGTTPTPSASATPFSYAYQVVDWDNQPASMIIATPTPDATTSKVFFRTTPGNPAGLQVFVKQLVAGGAFATASFPIQAADVTISPGFVEQDPFDVFTYTFNPPGIVPAATPYFSGYGTRGVTCDTTPAGYPSPSPNPVGTPNPTLNLTSLKDYKNCQFNWTPAAADLGKKFLYGFNIQDNFGATATANGMGVGGKHPAGNVSDSLIKNDSLSKTNGQAATFSINLEALEANSPPSFSSTSGGALITNYYGATPTPAAGAGWNAVFNKPGSIGVAPTGCTSQTGGFTCALSIVGPHAATAASPYPYPGDVLQSATAVSVLEDTSMGFTVYASDSNITAQLKTLSATVSKPTAVYIVDGVHAGRTLPVSSFSSIVTSQDITNGRATFTFSWKPTNSEANYLSNAGGVLIPLEITDQSYTPASDAAFPTAFNTGAMTMRIWVWATLTVANKEPVITYLNPPNSSTPNVCSSCTTGCTELTVTGSTSLSMETGKTTCYLMRIRDPDVARWTQSGVYTGYTPTYFPPTGSTFTSASPAGSAYLSSDGLSVVQDFQILGTPGSGDIKTWNAKVTTLDPGNPTLGYYLLPGANVTPTPSPGARAPLYSDGTSLGTTTFNIQVIGKPTFIAPTATPGQDQAYVYLSKPFYYPLSTFVSRPAELGQQFFFGIDSGTAVTPIKTTISGAGSTGIYITEKNILMWPDSTHANLTPVDRIIPIYAVQSTAAGAVCNYTGTTAGTYKTLVRFNVYLNKIETCKISNADITTNAASVNLTLSALDVGTVTTVNTLNSVELDRVYTPAPTPSDMTAFMNQQFVDFYARCPSLTCTTTLTPSNATANTTSIKNYAITMGSTSGYVAYSDSSTGKYINKFKFDTAAATGSPILTKMYQDTAPTNARSISVYASKDETLSFTATPNYIAGTHNSYRWYINGCLKSEGLITSASPINYTTKVSSLASGANNDCSGEFGYVETNAGSLGKMIVKLVIVNNTETISLTPSTSFAQMTTATSDASTVYYYFNVNVLNTNPNLVSASTYTPSAPVALTATTYLTGNMDVAYSTPLVFGSKNLFGFTDLTTTKGLKVRLREFNINGDLPSTGLTNLTLDCPLFNTGSPIGWIGYLGTASSLSIMASSVTSSPGGYGVNTTSCYTSALTTSNTSVSNASTASDNTPAALLAYTGNQNVSTNSAWAVNRSQMSTLPTAFYATTPSTDYTYSNHANFYAIQDYRATTDFWSASAFQSMYGTTAPSEIAGWAHNAVRKNIVYGNKLFALIGNDTPNIPPTGYRGFVLIRTLSTNSPKLVTSGTSRVMFGNASSASPSVTAGVDCQFVGTPVDGVYIPYLDTLYVYAISGESDHLGRLAAIKNISTSPACTVLGTLANGNINPTYDSNLNKMPHNPNVTKMVYDDTRRMIYGIVDSGTSSGNELYSLDIYTQQFTSNAISNLFPAEIIFSPNINAIHVFDNRKLCNGVACNPTLYKVW